MEEAEQREQECISFVNSGNPEAALSVALANPFYKFPEQEKLTKQQKKELDDLTKQIKTKNFETAMNVLMAIQEKSIKSSIDKLNQEEINLLMKFIYRGLEYHQHSSTLFKWHAATLEKGGIGCIVRAIADRNKI
ncbi:arp2/3 complex 16 kd subunit p16-arc [Anaeramoeba ignava]|uniref:Actin-related protein 2/3 complex subunit 5 n=1 Tax=Anaeramoeba ignava TaxID=1746090 RepID=A0A9Q0L6W3_ANAIG|nr:arp2/3 complex 16 kd subunit p16-arc [Anaeramoeba ignava]|eukprot:Anaeramoba_ignava/a489396_228.p1 GENE.a489396_228~~a489396_228.p1  ORF type:complete len:135 (-),score=58.09 a489396_228:88-492(-)